jgi:hypothetical protein
MRQHFFDGLLCGRSTYFGLGARTKAAGDMHAQLNFIIAE